MHPLAIIGIDPGTTSAYSILDLNGSILKQHSGKELTLAMMIEQVMEVGQPLIISTDKAKVPSFVEELSRKLGTITLAPPEDLKREEKWELINKSGHKEHSKDQHQADSLAAALYAHKKYLPKLDKIDLFIREKKLEYKRDEFFRIALTTDFHFSQIHRLLTEPSPENRIMERVVSQQRITKKDFLSLYQRLMQVQERNKQLERSIEEQRDRLTLLHQAKQSLEKHSSSLGQNIDKLFHFKDDRLKIKSQQLQQQERKNFLLKKKVHSLMGFISKIPAYQLVKKLSTLGQKEYQEKESMLAFKDREILYVENPDIYSEQVLKELREKDITVLSPRKAGKRIRTKIKTGILTRDDMIDENEYFALIEPKLIDRLVSADAVLEKVIREYQDKRRKGKNIA